MMLINWLRRKFESDRQFVELLKGSGVAFVLKVGGIAISYIFTLTVTRILGAEAWGIFALCLVVLQISSVIAKLGMDTALLRFTAEYVVKGRPDVLEDIYIKVLKIVVPFSIIIMLTVYFLSPVLAKFLFKKAYLMRYFRLISFAIVPFVLLWIHSEIIRGLKRVKQYMLLQQTGIFSVALINFIVGLYLISRKLEMLVLCYVASVIFLSIVSFFLWRNYLAKMFDSLCSSNLSFLVRKARFSYRTLFSVSIPMLFSSILVSIIGWVDLIILGMFGSAHDVGVYNVVQRLAAILGLVLVAMNVVLTPKFAELFTRGKLEELKQLAYMSTRLTFSLSLPIFVFLIVFSEEILRLFGRDFEEGKYILFVLSIGQMINIAAGSVGAFLSMVGEQVFFLKTMFFSLIVNIILNLILVNLYGVLGIAVATVFSKFLSNLMFVLYVKWKYKINFSII